MTSKTNDTSNFVPIASVEDQWEHDVKQSGDDAYKKWRWYGIRDYPISRYGEFNDNMDVYDTINNGFDDVAERKPTQL